MKCDTCGKETPEVKRVVVDKGYDRALAKPLYNCPECYEKKISVVRRVTGGGAVFHGEDLTFSLVVKKEHPCFRGAAKDSYLKVNEVLRIAFKSIYPEIDYADCKSSLAPRGGARRICFEEPVCYDLLLKGKKVLGASQRRRGGVVLHQSSLCLKSKPEV